MLIVFLCLSGCSFGETKEPQPEAIAEEVIPTPKSNMQTITLYTIDTNNMVVSPIVVKKENHSLTAEYVTKLICKNLNDDEISIYRIKQNGKRVIISFAKNGKPIKNCTKKMEGLILDCFANSLLDNVENCSEVVFQCEGKAYRSQYRSYKKDEVYASE